MGDVSERSNSFNFAGAGARGDTERTEQRNMAQSVTRVENDVKRILEILTARPREEDGEQGTLEIENAWQQHVSEQGDVVAALREKVAELEAKLNELNRRSATWIGRMKDAEKRAAELEARLAGDDRAIFG